MALVMTLPTADFSNKGLQNVNPFVSMDDAEMAFDFRSRANRLEDLTGKHTLSAFRHDIQAGQLNVPDSSVVMDADGGRGIVIEMGYLVTDLTTAEIPLDGSKQFTVLVVGGYSGLPFLEEDVAITTPRGCSLFDYGTGITSSHGFSLETQYSEIGLKAQAPGVNVSSDMPSPNTPCAMFLTFDGTQYSLINKTLGEELTNTVVSLGGTNPITVDKLSVANVVMGHYHRNSTINALAPKLYQVCMWNKVLSAADIEEQYLRTQAVLSGIAV